jgi:serine/threonine protein kinase
MSQLVKDSCCLLVQEKNHHFEKQRSPILISGHNKEKIQVIKTVEPYTIYNKKLGAASYFSVVYYAMNEVTKRPVAVKIVKNNCMTGNSVENELSLLTKVKNAKRIVKLEAFIEDIYNYYMVFELADSNLMDYYNNVIFPVLDEEMVFRIFRKIALAVKELHESGIAHRDIKLENILIFSKKCKKTGNESFKLKLADLGLSKFSDKNKKFSDYCGSPIYSAPEVNSGMNYIGFKYDIWSLGIILYYLIHGDFPFNVFEDEVGGEDDDPEEIKKKIIEKLFYKIQNDDLYFEPEKNCSEELKSIMIWLLKKNPEDRPYIEEVFSHPWFLNNKHVH